jgi:uncharacterized protein YlxP (DUF503 family)
MNSFLAAKVVIGVARIVLHVPESGSLKSKRQVVSGLLRRLRQELKVAAAEVGELDRWQLAEIAIVTVSGDHRQADRVLAAALAFIEAHADGAQVTDVSTELLPL